MYNFQLTLEIGEESRQEGSGVFLWEKCLHRGNGGGKVFTRELKENRAPHSVSPLRLLPHQSSTGPRRDTETLQELLTPACNLSIVTHYL